MSWSMEVYDITTSIREGPQVFQSRSEVSTANLDHRRFSDVGDILRIYGLLLKSAVDARLAQDSAPEENEIQ